MLLSLFFLLLLLLLWPGRPTTFVILCVIRFAKKKRKGREMPFGHMFGTANWHNQSGGRSKLMVTLDAKSALLPLFVFGEESRPRYSKIKA